MVNRVGQHIPPREAHLTRSALESYPNRFPLYLSRYVLFTIIYTYDALSWWAPLILPPGLRASLGMVT